MTAYEMIVEKAVDHGERYKTFKMRPLLNWVRRQSASWLDWAATQPICKLNRMMKAEIWAARQADEKCHFTEEPPEDGPQ